MEDAMAEPSTRELAETLVAFIRTTESNLATQRRLSLQVTRLLLGSIQQIATEFHVLKLALLRRDAVALADLEEAEKQLRAGWAVEAAVNPELEQAMAELRRLEAELDEEVD